ncbi:helix-turn-helix domain-containing protein [Streptosporangium vulgare]
MNLPTWARRLKTERLERCWSQKDVARRLTEAAYEHAGMSLPSRESLTRMLRDWEAGRARPRPPYPRLLALVFGLDESELFESLITPDSPVPVDVSVHDPFALNGRPADTDYVTMLRQTIQALVALDGAHGGNEVFPLSLRVFRIASAKLAAGNFTAGIERDLEAAAGEAGEVAAWMAYDADRHDASRQIIQEALMLSRLAGDRGMELFELAHLSMLSLYRHRPREALRIADDVLNDGGLPPRVAAIFDVRRGRALATMGDRPRGFDALRRARSALAESINTRDPYWTWWMDEAELAWHEGMAHAELGEWRQAVAPIAEAFVRRSIRGRSRYQYAAQLLNALVHAQAWREAEPIIVDVMEQAGEVGSARTANLLLRVADRIEHAGTSTTSTLADSAQDLRRMLACS